MTTDQWQLVIGVTQAVALLGTLGFIAYELFFVNRRRIDEEREERAFDAYRRLMEQFMRQLWHAADRPELNCVWDPLDAGRRRELDAAQARRPWGAWYEMTDEERSCYWWTLGVLELFEQALEMRRRDWMTERSWRAVEQQVETWRGTRYFPYVTDDWKERLPVFAEEIAAHGGRSESP